MSPENPIWPLDVNTLLVGKRFDKGQVKPPVQTTQQTQHVAVERMDCCYEWNTMAWREARGVLFWKAGTVCPSPMCSYTRVTLWSAVWSGSPSLFSLYLREKKYANKTTKNNMRPGQWWHSRFEACILLISLPVLMTTNGSFLWCSTKKQM